MLWPHNRLCYASAQVPEFFPAFQCISHLPGKWKHILSHFQVLVDVGVPVRSGKDYISGSALLPVHRLSGSITRLVPWFELPELISISSYPINMRIEIVGLKMARSCRLSTDYFNLYVVAWYWVLYHLSNLFQFSANSINKTPDLQICLVIHSLLLRPMLNFW